MWVYPVDHTPESKEKQRRTSPADPAKEERLELRFSDGTRAKHYKSEPQHIGRKMLSSDPYNSGQNAGSEQQFRKVRAETSGSHRTPAHPAAKDAAPNRKKGRSNGRSCSLFVFFYTTGLLLGGVLYGLCGQKELLFLQTYIQLLQTANLSAQPFRLFGLLFLCAAAAVTLVLIFSLCAFGVPLLLLLTALYGVGSGLIAAGLFAAYSWQGIFIYLFAVGMYNAVVGCSICVFSRFGADMATNLFALATRSDKSIPQALYSRQLQNFVRRYVCLLLLLAPVCGLCATFPGLAGSFLA